MQMVIMNCYLMTK